MENDKTIGKLNELLSDVQVAYMNVKGFHWNVKGQNFFMLHEKYEELYNELAENGDEIAERILMLEGKPLHSYSDFIKHASVKEIVDISEGKETVKAFLNDLDILMKKERELIAIAEDSDDDVTADLAIGMLESQEKTKWMLKSFLS